MTDKLQSELTKGLKMGIPAEELMGWVRHALAKDHSRSSSTATRQKKKKESSNLGDSEESPNGAVTTGMRVDGTPIATPPSPSASSSSLHPSTTSLFIALPLLDELLQQVKLLASQDDNHNSNSGRSGTSGGDKSASPRGGDLCHDEEDAVGANGGLLSSRTSGGHFMTASQQMTAKPKTIVFSKIKRDAVAGTNNKTTTASSGLGFEVVTTTTPINGNNGDDQHINTGPSSSSAHNAADYPHRTTRVVSLAAVDAALRTIADHITMQSLKEKGLRTLLTTAKQSTVRAAGESESLRRIIQSNEDDKQRLEAAVANLEARLEETNAQLERLAYETVLSTRFMGNDATYAKESVGIFEGVGANGNNRNIGSSNNGTTAHDLSSRIPRGPESTMLMAAVQRALDDMAMERNNALLLEQMLGGEDGDEEDTNTVRMMASEGDDDEDEDGNGNTTTVVEPISGVVVTTGASATAANNTTMLSSASAPNSAFQSPANNALNVNMSGGPSANVSRTVSMNPPQPLSIEGGGGGGDGGGGATTTAAAIVVPPRRQRRTSFAEPLLTTSAATLTANINSATPIIPTIDIQRGSVMLTATAGGDKGGGGGGATPSSPTSAFGSLSPNGGGGGGANGFSFGHLPKRRQHPQRSPSSLFPGLDTGDALQQQLRRGSHTHHLNHHSLGQFLGVAGSAALLTNSVGGGGQTMSGTSSPFAARSPSVYGATLSISAAQRALSRMHLLSGGSRGSTALFQNLPSTAASGGGGGGGYSSPNGTNTAIQLHDLQQRVQELTRANKRLRRRYEEAFAHNKGLHTAAMGHNDQLSQYREAAERLQTQLEETLKDTDAVMKQKNKRIEDLEMNTVPTLKTAQAALQEQIGALEAALAFSRRELFAEKMAFEAQIDDLQTEIQQLRAEKAAVQSQLDKREVALSTVPHSNQGTTGSKRHHATVIVGGNGAHFEGGDDNEDARLIGSNIVEHYHQHGGPHSGLVASVAVTPQKGLYVNSYSPTRVPLTTAHQINCGTVGSPSAAVVKLPPLSPSSSSSAAGAGASLSSSLPTVSTHGRMGRAKIEFDDAARGGGGGASPETNNTDGTVVASAATLSLPSKFLSPSSGGDAMGASHSPSPSNWSQLVADLQSDIAKDNLNVLRSRGPPKRLVAIPTAGTTSAAASSSGQQKQVGGAVGGKALRK